MNVPREPAYSNGLVRLKKVGDLFTTTSDWAPVTVTTNANVNRLCALLTTNRCLMTLMLLVELGINHESVHQLLHDKLHIRKLCTKLVPNALAHSLSWYANIWRKKYFHVAIPTLQPRPRSLQLLSVYQT